MSNSQSRTPRYRRCVQGLVLVAALSSPLAAPAEEAPLSPLDLAGLLKVVEARGSRAGIPPAVQSTLGLNAAQVSPAIKQAVYRDDEGGRHGFAPLNDRSGYFMFHLDPSSGQSVFHVDRQLHLVRAARSFKSGDDLIALPEAEAQRELRQEFARWSRVLAPGAAPSAPASTPDAGPPKPAAR
jgi:hypothetical protein